MELVEERIMPEIVVELRGEFGSDLADYARDKVIVALTHTGRPLLRAHVRIMRHPDPARERPVDAHASLDLDGRLVQVHASAARPQEAVDLLVKRLAHRLERISHVRHHGAAERTTPRTGNVRRAYSAPSSATTEDDREIVRHTTVSPTPCTVDEAVEEMDDEGLDFHLFVEAGSGQDAVVYRSGSTGLRLSRADGSSDQLEPDEAMVTVSSQSAPLLDTAEAMRRLALTGLPFLFYVDADHERANVLYHRSDGDYGLIDPV